MNKEEFYIEVAKILQIDGYSYKDYTRMPKRRWRPRIPANGCFPGKAWVQWFSEDCIRIHLNGAIEWKIFTTPEDAIKWLIDTRIPLQQDT